MGYACIRHVIITTYVFMPCSSTQALRTHVYYIDLFMTPFDPLEFRSHFPLLSNKVNRQTLVYFDNGATTQKPKSVIERYQDFYEYSNANVHRASHALSATATTAFEQSRSNVQKLLNAAHVEEIIFTKGTTESINLLAQSYARPLLQPGDNIVLTQSEHHANIVPWQIVAKQTGATIHVLPLDEQGRTATSSLEQYITHRTKIVCCGHISNVLGRINPIEKIIAQAKNVGAKTLIDGAQAIAHLAINVQTLDCDFYVFSAHKMYGPTGVGILYGRKSLLNAMPPYQAGGEMIKHVSFKQPTTYNQLPYKFEAGTPNIAGVLALNTAIEFMQSYSLALLAHYETSLIDYAMEKLRSIKEVRYLVAGKPDIPVISFRLSEEHSHDVAAVLDSHGIAVRSGHHCAQPLMEFLNINGCLRLSLAPYNTFDEIDFFVEKLSAYLKNENRESPVLNAVVSINEQKTKISDVAPQTENLLATQSEQTLPSSEEILALFSQAKGWDGKHRIIMQLSKKLAARHLCERNETSLISGCESLAWLTIESKTVAHEKCRYAFYADSDAKVIRGLLVIIIAVYNNKTAQDIEALYIKSYFEQLGLLQHLSPSRGNGVWAIVNKIKQLSMEDLPS